MSDKHRNGRKKKIGGKIFMVNILVLGFSNKKNVLVPLSSVTREELEPLLDGEGIINVGFI